MPSTPHTNRTQISILSRYFLFFTKQTIKRKTIKRQSHIFSANKKTALGLSEPTAENTVVKKNIQATIIYFFISAAITIFSEFLYQKYRPAAVATPKNICAAAIDILNRHTPKTTSIATIFSDLSSTFIF